MKKLFATLMLTLLLAASAFAAPHVPDTYLASGPNAIAAAATVAHWISDTDTTPPTTRAAVLTDSLANVAVSGVATDGCGTGSEDFDIANGDTSGKKLTLCGQTPTLTANGTVKFVCLIDGTTGFYGCFPIAQTPTVPTIADYTTETWTAAAHDLWEVRDAQ